ncbi:hypothetical protein PHISCL_10623 [Aspergillus sclerotialis]|uniref:Uncharacterized protein n=1 Tax=Aspergillus sclerotialis TaxID=2070753 RepID=A0A3A2Z2P5_9EURO|nr:hypothetical protein PHISCL_10623 [Aspergillus sclerotialis]
MYGCYPGSELDRALYAYQRPDEGVFFMTPDTVPLGTPHPVAGITSPAESVSTPGPDGGVSSYSTPSTMYCGSPQLGERTLPGLIATMSNQSAESTMLVSDWSRQSRISPAATGSN